MADKNKAPDKSKAPEKKRGYYEPGKRLEQYGIYAFVMAGRLLYNGLHWHDEVEILYCRLGHTRILIEGRPYELAAGDFITIGSGKPHEITGSEDSLQIICSIDQTAFVGHEACDFDYRFIRGLDEPSDAKKETRNLLGEMAALLNGPGWIRSVGEDSELARQEVEPLRFRYLSLQYALLALLSEHRSKSGETVYKQKDAVHECVRYINEHLGEELSAETLAGQLHVSQPTVYRLFKEQIGMHLGEYIAQLRVDAACRYLLESDAKVIEIAYRCGFSGLSNFYRVFKKYRNCSPAEYRRDHQQRFGDPMAAQPDIMKLNRFIHFSQLAMGPEVWYSTFDYES